MVSKFLIIIVLVSAALTAFVVHADGSSYDPREVTELKKAISTEIAQSFRQFNSPRVELGVIRLLSGALPAKIESVSLQSENARGQAQFAVYGPGDQAAEVLADYAAFVRVRVSTRRITPGERLSNDSFAIQEVNVATGLPYEQRGVLLSDKEDVSKLETRQTILEGQNLVSNAVEKVPDIRRGDSVRIQLVTGDLNLSTQGTAAEPAYNNSTVRVVTSSTHRELTGTLLPGGVVEVKL